MKKFTKLFAMLFFIATLSVTNTACDESDDEPQTDQDQQEIIDNTNNPSTNDKTTNDPTTNDQTASNAFTETEINSANTAKDAKYLTNEEKLVIFYCNLARLNGAKFAEAYLADLKGSDNSYEKSLLTDLAKVKDLSMLMVNENLCKAAKAHVNDIGPKGLVQHESSDGTATFTRVRSYYNGGSMAENISFGQKNALSIVRQLLIDKNTESLGHRKNILNNAYVRIGVAIGNHSVYNTMCCQDFSDAMGD